MLKKQTNFSQSDREKAFSMAWKSLYVHLDVNDISKPDETIWALTREYMERLKECSRNPDYLREVISKGLEITNLKQSAELRPRLYGLDEPPYYDEDDIFENEQYYWINQSAQAQAHAHYDPFLEYAFPLSESSESSDSDNGVGLSSPTKKFKVI